MLTYILGFASRYAFVSMSRNPLHPERQIVLYEYQKTRNASHPRNFLKDYTGICVTDGYQVYHTLEKEREDLRIADYWVHCRRRFHDALEVIPKAHQKESILHLFIKQIELAKSLNKPIAVHARDAMQDTYDIMKAHHHKGVLHCFSGTKEMAVEFTKLGYYIALGGALTFKNARHSVEVCKTVESKYLLTETDCPYMSPEPLRGTRNEPCNIPYILEKMAAVREVSVESMQKIVENNYERFLHGE